MARKHDDLLGQAWIPLTREARLKLLSAVEPVVAGLSRRTWLHVAELLTQIELRSSGEGCYCYCETLWTVMYGGRGVPRSTFFRVRGAAGRLHLLIGDERHNRQGRTSNVWRVDWQAVAALAARSGTALAGDDEALAAGPQRDLAAGRDGELSAGRKSETDRRQSGTDPCQSGTDRSHTGTHPLRGLVLTEVLTSVRSLGSTRFSEARAHGAQGEKRVDQVRGDRQASESRASRRAGEPTGGAGRAGRLPPAIDLDQVRDLAERIERRVGACRSSRDWQLAVKVALLSRAFGEQWLWGAVEGLIRVRERSRVANGWAYLTRVLQEATRRQGRALNRELAKITLPPELLLPTRPDAAATSERMCVAEEL